MEYSGGWDSFGFNECDSEINATRRLIFIFRYTNMANNSSLSKIQDDINKLQAMEQELLGTLETSPNLTLPQKKSLNEKINKITGIFQHVRNRYKLKLNKRVLFKKYVYLAAIHAKHGHSLHV